MSQRGLWLEETVEPLPRPAWQGQPDVVVIGGGVTGCSCALTLAGAGLRVRLHDAREVAGGASGRNAGFALRGLALPHDVARAVLGPDLAREWLQRTEDGLRRLSELAGDAFRPVGSLRLAASEREAAELDAEQAALEADGFAVERLELAPPLSELYLGALHHPGDGALVPARWVRRLARRAAEAGVDVCEHTPTTVEAARAEADAVVVCTDGATAALLPELASVCRPTRGQVLATEPLPERLYERPHYARDGYDYWQQLPDGRLVLGGCRDVDREAEFTGVEQPSQPVQAALEAVLERLTGARPRITHRWAGVWGETPDRLPLAGPVPGRDGVYVAGGFSGHGNVPGLVLGELVARTLLGEPQPALTQFALARFS